MINGSDMNQSAQVIPLLRNHQEQIGKLRRQLEELFTNLNLIHDLMTVCAYASTSDQGDCGSEVSRCLELIGGNRLYGQMKTLTKIIERLGGETEFTEREATTKAIWPRTERRAADRRNPPGSRHQPRTLASSNTLHTPVRCFGRPTGMSYREGMSENLPPLPGTEDPPPNNPSLTAYVLRGREWVQVGTATAHPDGMGHRLRLDIAPADGDVIELRTVDGTHIPGNQRAPRAKRKPWTPRAKPRT
jgi:hypothetical protein